MIRAVFFDLDGTLYDRDAAILRMAEEQFEAFREELGVDKPVFMEHLVALGWPRSQSHSTPPSCACRNAWLRW